MRSGGDRTSGQEASGRNWVPFVCLALALVGWKVMAAHDLFERFYTFSRGHEDLELDELVLLALNLCLAFLVAIVHQSAHLRRIIADREWERQRADRNARHDPLTGLANRHAFEGELTEVRRGWTDAEPRVVAIADLDRFKPVNDIHGHAAGDATLRAVARRLTEVFDGVAFTARLGGDEFAVLFGARCDADLAERYMRRLIASIESPIDAEGAAVRIGCSVGLTLWHRDEETPDVLRRADKALYAAKVERGKFAWYDAELDRRSTERAIIEADLRAAIRAGQVIPHFQPVFEMGSRRLRGFEVLARWAHPTRGEIPPKVFVEIAEDAGLIAELGWTILRQACRAAASWESDLRIAVNISPVQFHDQALADILSGILAETGFPPSRLEVEITENAVIRDFQSARATIGRLRALGISIALDDFGTGYSSLASLRDLPFDRLKIDRTFVTNIADLPDNQKVVTGIMALAKGFQLAVTAEGIESERDLEFMASLECALGQGYWFERPMPADMVEWMMETRWCPRTPRAEPSETEAKTG